LTDGSDNITEFYHDGGELVICDGISIVSGGQLSDSWADQTAFNIPSFSRKVHATIKYTYIDQPNPVFVRPDGAQDCDIWVGDVAAGSTISTTVCSLILPSSHIIEAKETTASANQLTIYQNGWYFPYGM